MGHAGHGRSPAVVLAAVKAGRALLWASPDLRRDPAVVAAAARQDRDALQWAAEAKPRNSEAWHHV